MKQNRNTIHAKEKTLGLLNFYKDKDNRVSITNEELTEQLKISKRTIVRYLNYLEDEKKIRKIGRKYRTLEIL